MKKLLVVILGLLLFVTAYVGVWMQYPQLHNSALLQESYQAGLAQYQSMAKEVADPESNGYLAPGYARFWAGEASEGGVAEPILRWRSQAVVGDHRLMVETQNKGYMSAREDFSEFVPDLHRAFRKPYFADPRPRLLSAFEPPRYRENLVSTAEGLAGYAQSLLMEGPSGEGIDTTVSLSKLGRHLQARGQLVDRLQGVRVSEMAFATFVAALSHHSSWTEDDLTLLAETVAHSRPEKNHLRHALEDEVAAGSTTFIRINEGRFVRHPDLKRAGLLLKLPGMLVREERIYYNYLTDALELLDEDPTEFPDRRGSWISGKRGMLTMTLVKFPEDYPRRIKRLELQAQMAELVLAILLEKSRYGEWPLEIDSLARSLKVPLEDLQYASAADRAELVWKVTLPYRQLKGWPQEGDCFGTRDGAFVFRL